MAVGKGTRKALPRSGRKHSGARVSVGRRDVPLTPDEILQRDNLPASAPVPPKIADRLATRRLIVANTEKPVAFEELARIQRGRRAAYSLALSARAVVGVPGRTLSRLPFRRSTTRVTRRTVTFKPYRPKWVDHVFHPKRSVPQSWARGPVVRRGYSGEVYYGVFPPDDRAVYYPSGYPWHCVGKIFAWNNASSPWPAWTGSGVLIGPRLVLTAGHVVPWDAATWMMRFVPAYYDGNSILGAGGESYVSDAQGWDLSYVSRTPNAHDMAVLRLYDPLGDWLGYFGSKPYWQGYPEMRYWNVTGYPAVVASAERPSYQPGIEVVDVEPDGNAIKIEHLGDTTNGNSGGPFWATWPDGFPYAIGTVSGGEASWDSSGNVIEDVNVVAGGNDLNDLIRWGRANWP
jgi:Trypsin